LPDLGINRPTQPTFAEAGDVQVPKGGKPHLFVELLHKIATGHVARIVHKHGVGTRTEWFQKGMSGGTIEAAIRFSTRSAVRLRPTCEHHFASSGPSPGQVLPHD